MRYLLIDREGTILNRIIWDGVSKFTPPQGVAVILESEYHHPGSQDPAIPSVDQFNPPKSS